MVDWFVRLKQNKKFRYRRETALQGALVLVKSGRMVLVHNRRIRWKHKI